MNNRYALIIGNSSYADPGLSRLKAPDADVIALEAVLKDADIGGFTEVKTLLNRPATDVNRAIAQLFDKKDRDDLLLLYFSGHGVLDEQGHLYLAVHDTEREWLRATAIPAGYITQEMDQSRSNRQVLILDCCHSGAFARGSKGVVGSSVGTAALFASSGFGRVVLTATDATQYAWEGDQVISAEVQESLFTHFLIQGLKTGEADHNGDGWVALDELYDYVYDQVRQRTSKQTPGKWSFKQQGEIVLARAVIKPTRLPEEIEAALHSPLPGVRAGAVGDLAELLSHPHPGLRLAARKALERLTQDDSRRVSEAARQALAPGEKTAGSTLAPSIKNEAGSAAISIREGSRQAAAETGLKSGAPDAAVSLPVLPVKAKTPAKTGPVVPAPPAPSSRKRLLWLIPIAGLALLCALGVGIFAAINLFRRPVVSSQALQATDTPTASSPASPADASPSPTPVAGQSGALIDASKNWPIVQEENFTNGTDWATGTQTWGDNQASLQVADGVYQVDLTDNSDWIFNPVFKQTYSDFRCDLDLKYPISSGDAGILFHAVDGNNYYSVSIPGHGGVVLVNRTVNQKTEPIIPPTSTKIENFNPADWTHLTVIDQAGHIVIYVNDVFVGENIGDYTFASGKWGLYAQVSKDYGYRVIYRNVVVRAP